MAANKTENYDEWHRSFKLWMKARGKTHDEVINDFAGSSLLFAVKFTPKAKKTGFLGAAYKPVKVAATGDTIMVRRTSKSTKKKFYHVLASGLRRSSTGFGGWSRVAGVQKGKGNYQEALRIYDSRRRSIGASDLFPRGGAQPGLRRRAAENALIG